MKRISCSSTRPRRVRAAWITAASLAGLAASVANAGTTASFTTGGSLLTPGSYSPAGLPNNTTDVTLTTTTSALSITAGTLTMESLTDASTSVAYAISDGTSTSANSTLTLGNSSGFTNANDSVANDLIAVTGSKALTISGANTGSPAGTGTLGLVLASSGNFDLSNTGTLTVSAVISDGGNGYGITETGSSTLTLSGANTFSGGLTLSAGTLNINNGGTSSGSALGTGTFKINGGTIENTSGADLTVATNNAQTWAGDFAFKGSSSTTNNLNLGTGAVTLTGNRQISISGTTSNLTVGGAIGDGSNGYSLTVTGTGNNIGVILTGSNSYSGGTTVTANILEIASANALPTTGNVYVGKSTGTPSAELLLYNPAVSTLTASYGASGQALTLNGAGISGGNSGALRVDAIAGGFLNATYQGAVTLASNSKITPTTGNSLNLTGNVTDGGFSIQKQGGGTLTLSGTGNNLTGTLAVGNGTVVLANASGAAITGASAMMTVASTGTLQMGAANQFNATTPAPVMLTGATGTGTAATFSVNGNSQGSTTANGVGALTLANASVNNVLDFGQKAAVITFAGFNPNGAVLTINNYVGTGSPVGTSALGSNDELIFNTNVSTETANFNFGFGAGTDVGVQQIGTSGFYEVYSTVPIPEPATVIGGLLMAGALGWKLRRRLAHRVEV